MKNILLLFLIILCFSSCGKKEESKLEAFNAEAFAFSVDGGWEINAAVRVKGFKQNLQSENYMVKLSYSIAIITPAKDTINNIAADKINETQKEEISDLPVEAQIVLDSTYSSGKYQLLFNVKDELSGNTAVTQKDVELE